MVVLFWATGPVVLDRAALLLGSLLFTPFGPRLGRIQIQNSVLTRQRLQVHLVQMRAYDGLCAAISGQMRQISKETSVEDYRMAWNSVRGRSAPDQLVRMFGDRPEDRAQVV